MHAYYRKIHHDLTQEKNVKETEIPMLELPGKSARWVEPPWRTLLTHTIDRIAKEYLQPPSVMILKIADMKEVFDNQNSLFAWLDCTKTNVRCAVPSLTSLMYWWESDVHRTPDKILCFRGAYNPSVLMQTVRKLADSGLLIVDDLSLTIQFVW